MNYEDWPSVLKTRAKGDMSSGNINREKWECAKLKKKTWNAKADFVGFTLWHK